MKHMDNRKGNYVFVKSLEDLDGFIMDRFHDMFRTLRMDLEGQHGKTNGSIVMKNLFDAYYMVGMFYTYLSIWSACGFKDSSLEDWEDSEFTDVRKDFKKFKDILEKSVKSLNNCMVDKPNM